MRFNSFTLLLLGLLGLLAVSAPSRSNTGDNGVVKVIDIPHGVDVGLTAKNLDLGAADTHDLEKRRGRSGGSRATRRPKKTRTKKKKTKRPTKKKPTKKKPIKKPKSKRPTKPKKPTTTKPKKPTKSAKPQCKKPKPCKGKNCKRVEPAAGASCQLQTKEKETVNYKTALAAAKRAGVRHLSIGQSYLLVHRDSRTPMTHKVLVMGKVKKNLQGQLDFEATGIDLEWDTDVKNDLLAKCTQLYGARCEHHKIEPYKCEYSIAKHKHGSYKFAGSARPEFADPEVFKETAKDIIEKHKTYSYFYNNCKKHVGRVQNVVAMPKNEDPAYPDEWENF
ncbi:hypothetical protein DPSP01_003271 [Paraphaeosphaeria sporulosa]|uniref:Uncharacterized protein n=1 Tax=Paraphaeosphaeria sporulosa TaxID=1460663 RepID=A0A177CYZ2_9PLEO|nr:uncharacterized protein CC84DRAFT_1201154 [Paraphaeosphaeria sporulosa]OAG12050.1 hypothetical protein CC84DRAFT_1201154 [Paraphaeosphaeria sporulosa]